MMLDYPAGAHLGQLLYRQPIGGRRFPIRAQQPITGPALGHYSIGANRFDGCVVRLVGFAQ